MKFASVTFFGTLISLVLLTYAGSPVAWAGNSRTPASHGGTQEVEKPLKITGQSRNLSMMLVLKSDKDKVKFVNVRRNFKDKVGDTKF